MKEITGDLWDYWMEDDTYICITTNGIVKTNGRAVMGVGIAKQARDKVKDLDLDVGRAINKHGNHVHYLAMSMVTFPTKNHWQEKSSIELIKRSCEELMIMLDSLQTDPEEFDVERIILPRPGCNNGGLDWESEVKPAIENILDDRIWIISPEEFGK